MFQRLDGVREANRCPWVALTPFILQKSRMRKRARTDLCGGRSAMIVPTATKWRCQCGCRMLAGRVEDWRGIPKVEPSRCSPFPSHTARSQVAAAQS